MNIVVGIIVGLIVLMVLVVLHEFGHFVAARRNGVRVLEFGIGFPPRAVAWIKDPKTHKWRRLKKSEWGKTNMTKAVGVEKDAKALKVEGDEKNALAEKAGRNKKRPKLIEDGLIFSINWLPIGGFCQMDGESAVDERPGTFGKANFWQKTKILFAGVAMNWLTAFVIFTILAWAGMPVFLENQFTVEGDTRDVGGQVEVMEVVSGSPAEKAGFSNGDYILAGGVIKDDKSAEDSAKDSEEKDDGEVLEQGVDWQTEFSYGGDVTAFNREHVGEKVAYKILRRGEPGCNCDANAVLVATLNGEDAEYLLGVSMSSTQAKRYSTWSAPVVGAGLTLQITGETFKGVGDLLWNLISGTGRLFSFDAGVREEGQAAISSVGDSVSGPVGIIGVLFPSFTASGPENLAFLAALISVSLACMNVLPIPALDGGRWLLIAIYKLRGKKLTQEKEQKIVSRAFLILIILMIAVTILDITRFF